MLCDNVCQCNIHARKFNICYMMQLEQSALENLS